MPAPDYAAEIAALRDALSAGELTVESNGDRVTYQSFDDLKKRIDYFVNLASAAATPAAAQPAFGFSAVGFDRN